MVDCNDWTRLGQSVALNYGKPELAPELFNLGFYARAPSDKGPKLPSESSVDPAKSPPACNDAGNSFRLGCRQSDFFRKMPLDFVAQGFEHSWNGHNHGYAVVVGQSNQIARTDFITEYDGSLQKYGNKESHGLA